MCQFAKDSKEVYERRLYPLTNSKNPRQNVYGGGQNVLDPRQK